MLALVFVALAACGGNGDVGKPDAGPQLPDDASTPDASTPNENCGDGVRQTGELCDDGNQVAGDGCAAGCEAVESGWVCETPGRACYRISGCGNGRVEANEECDDRNVSDGDGCTSQCVEENGWNCPNTGGRCQAEACGDRIIAGDEECEDGNNQSGDGCSNVCRLESGYKCPSIGQPCSPTDCGDGIREGTEQCDDGNNDLGDGCTPLCTKEPSCANGTCQATCGDGVMLPNSTAEECDDGNTRSNDGCSASCRLEEGFVCELITTDPPATVQIPVVLRDFRGYDLPATSTLPRGHIDFQNPDGTEKGILGPLYAPLSNPGKKPVYAKGDGSTSLTTHGAATFDQWYRDADKVNVTVADTLTLVRQSNGSYVFDDQTYFPLDNKGWVAAGGEQMRTVNEGGVQVQHNFHFTSEARYWFEYKGNEVLTFRGDDDVWVFINNRLAMDLGGVHAAQTDTITLSQHAAANQLDLRLGGIYEVVVLQAERRLTQSSYQLTLNGFTTRRTECRATCGNAVVDSGEQCDDGVNAGGYGQCARGCVWGPRCGDGEVQEANGEDCDDGNTSNGDACPATCKYTIG